MKLCLCCHTQAEDAAATCAACGEGSFGSSDGTAPRSGDDGGSDASKAAPKPKRGRGTAPRSGDDGGS